MGGVRVARPFRAGSRSEQIIGTEMKIVIEIDEVFRVEKRISYQYQYMSHFRKVPRFDIKYTRILELISNNQNIVFRANRGVTLLPG